MAMSGSRTLKVAQYCMLPQILPRFAALLFSGFDYFAYFMAQVYRGVRLLPEGHPFLNPSEIGHFSIPDVVAAAWARLKYRRENIDQVLIFYVILLGLVLMVLQAAFMLIAMFSPQAMALSLTDFFGNYHLTNGRDHYQDLAFILLDRVFGVPGIYDSCVSTANPCYMAAPNDTWANAATVYKPAAFPWPFHLALQALFSFYSTGLLIVAVLILLYFVVVIVAETAQTGTPFGRRFNKVWAPLRLVMALGLLIPISNGFNSAQYIVLYAAKLGSNFATNGWVQFNSKLSNGRPTSEEMIAVPKTPNMGDVLQFMMLAHTCKAVQEGILQQEAKAKDWRPEANANCTIDGGDQRNDAVINAYLVKYTGSTSGDAQPLESQSYAQAKTFFGNGDMTIRIGDRGCTKLHNTFSGHTRPTCGELIIPAPTQETNQAAGAYVIQKGYYDLVQYLWGAYLGGGSGVDATKIWAHYGFCANGIGGGTNMVQNYETSDFAAMTTGAGDMELRKRAIYYAQKTCPSTVKNNASQDVVTDKTIQTAVTADWLNGTYNNYMYGQRNAEFPGLVAALPGYSPAGSQAAAIVTNIIRQGVIAERAMVANGRYNIPFDLMDRGWGGAGLWYNKIASANGAVTGAAMSVPKIVRFPDLMMAVADAKLRNNKNVSAESLFTPTSGEDASMQMRREGEQKAVLALQGVYSGWRGVASAYKPQSGNLVYDFLNVLFGTQGLFDLRDPGNQGVHPLALMTVMGKSLLEASIRNIASAAVGNVGAGLLGSDKGGAIVGGISGALFMIASMTLGAGIILYYVLPFMPFVYFFFAVGAWVKAVFEAMVGVPLWALAHIRIDGDGLPGPAAINGYFLIFEIFIRPITIVFGLIAAVSIFAAMATTLNAVFDIAVINAGGTNFDNATQLTFMEFARGPIDQLFYTVMYAVLMYIMAMSSFKMIDLIPSQIMRWMGQSVSAFRDPSDSAAGLMSNMTQYGTGTASQAVSGIKEGSQGVGNALGSIAKSK